MFCTKCGRKNTEGVLFCEYCGNPMNQAPTASEKKYESKKNDSGKKKVLIAVFSALIILCLISAVLIIVGLKNKKDSDLTGGKGSYYKDFDEDDVIFPEDGEAYVDHQLLVTVDDDMTEEEFQKLMKSFGGKIVGYNSISNTYQVEFSKKSGDELLDLIDEITKERGVESASLNYVYYNESLIGSSNSLDDSLMGIDNSDYDDSLIGEVKVALIGTAIDKSGIGDLVPGANMADSKLNDGNLVSLYGWECEVANKADEGCKLFEAASKLVPTYDAEKVQMMEELNKDAADFINKMREKEYVFMILSSAQKDEPGFIDGIKDEKAMEQILCVASAADVETATGVDIFAEGDSPEAIEYATTIAIMTWANCVEMTGENLKDVLSNSFVAPLADGMPGLLNAELSTEVSRRLHDMIATATDSDYELNVEDILKMIEDVKVDLGLISLEDAPEEGGESEEDSTSLDFDAENERYRAYIETGYPELADKLGFTEMELEIKYTYADLDDDGIYELMIGNDEGIFVVVSEKGGEYQVSEVYDWVETLGANSAGYNGDGYFLTTKYYQAPEETCVTIIWKYDGSTGRCGIVTKISNSFSMDLKDEEGQSYTNWQLYNLIDENAMEYSEADLEGSDKYTYEYLDYADYYNNEKGILENEIIDKFMEIQEGCKGDGGFNKEKMKPLSDFQ